MKKISLLTSLATAIDNFLGTTGKHSFGWLHVIAIVLKVLFVMMPRGIIQLLIYTTREDKGRQGVEMSQKNYRVYHFRQGPTVYALCQFLQG